MFCSRFTSIPVPTARLGVLTVCCLAGLRRWETCSRLSVGAAGRLLTMPEREDELIVAKAQRLAREHLALAVSAGLIADDPCAR